VVGRACLMGVDLGALAERGMNGRGEAIGRMYVNGYEPSVDVLFRWVRDFYISSEPMPWLIATVPHGKDVSIVLTHDVDYTRSVTNARQYADLLRQHGVKGTFFIQSKYVKDWNDDIFFNDSTVPALRQLKDQGMELASHSVAHSRDFKNFPMGDGTEAYPKYRPFVIDQTHARGGTVLGELRVPKFLLEKETNAEVVSFRPGHLSYPQGLPQALAATGYSYSSSLPANSALTHLPYQTTYDRADASLEPVFEFPVTIEDEGPPRLIDRFDSAQQVIGAIARDHGVAVIMIHPDVAGQKLEFERRLIEAWQGRAWLGDLHTFGAWWSSRDQLETDVVQEGGHWVLKAKSGVKAVDVDIILPKTRAGVAHLTIGAQQAASLPLN
jgi:peptidoglycan/xylan/chitin deacetylase (PgdA/CDA1 family)